MRPRGPFLTSFRLGLKWQLCSEVCSYSQILIPVLFPSLAFTTIDLLYILLTFLLAHCLSPILLCQCRQVRGSAEFLSTYYMSGTAISTRDPEGNWCGPRVQCLLAQQRGLPACDWVTWGKGAKGSWYLCGGVTEAVLNWGQVNVFLLWVPCSLDCTRVHCVWPGPWTGGSLDPGNSGQITSCVSLTFLICKKKKILSPKCSLG